MSHLRFDGAGAGLGKQLGGNANSHYDYTLICTCKTELGVLGLFTPNKAGERSAFCPRCEHVTIVDKNGQTTYVKAPAEVIAKATAARLKQTAIVMKVGT